MTSLDLVSNEERMRIYQMAYQEGFQRGVEMMQLYLKRIMETKPTCTITSTGEHIW